MIVKTAVAVRHVAFEDLGGFEAVLRNRGFSVRYHDVGLNAWEDVDPLAPDLLALLGGPISVYEEHRYPFLTEELRLLQTRLAAGRPTLGICLGAQLLAKALGAKAYPGPRKEIGFAPLQLTAAGQRSCLAPFGAPAAVVLHWHGDTFDLPAGAARLASTADYPNQAFALGPNLLALQFHAEARALGFERWLIGHTAELSAAGVDVNRLRADAARYSPTIERHGAACLERWLDGLTP